MRKIFDIYILPLLMLLLIVMVWKSTGYLKKSMYMLSGIFEKKLPFKPNPMMIGGEIIAVIPDKINDNKKLQAGNIHINDKYYSSTDLISYKIHKMTININSEHIWNLDLEFNDLETSNDNPNLFCLIKGIVYIDLDNGMGSSLPFYKEDSISFGGDFNWDYFIEFDCLHKNGRMFSFSTKNYYPVQIEYKEKIQTVRLSLPLVEELNKNMDKIKMGKHIAAIGLYTPFENDNFIKINNIKYKDKNTKDSGNITNYFDFICGDMSFDRGKSVIEPVTINDYTSEVNIGDLKQIEDRLNSLSDEKGDGIYGNIADKELLRAYNYYDGKNYIEAQLIFNKYKENSSIANTYLGMIKADSAKETKNLDKKISLINECYDCFDKAEQLAGNKNDLYILLTNRINIGRSIPDEVFHKSDLLKKDLVDVLSIDKLTVKEKALFYKKLIELFKTKNNVRELMLLTERIKSDLIIK